MSSKRTQSNPGHSDFNAQPCFHQKSPEIQAYGTVSHMLPLELEEPIRLEMTEQLNQLLADTMTLRDLYKKSHWQTSGPTFYQLHLLFDKHYGEQAELVDAIAERIQLLGGVSIAMAPDVAETTKIERAPRGREEVPVQLSRLLDAHQIIIGEARILARLASKLEDDGDQRPCGERRSSRKRITGVVSQRTSGRDAFGSRCAVEVKVCSLASVGNENAGLNKAVRQIRRKP